MPHCAADCTIPVDKEGDFCPEHEDQFSTTGTRGSIMHSSVGDGDFDRRGRPSTSTKEKGSSPGLMANLKEFFEKKSKGEGKRPTEVEKKPKDQADNMGANEGF